MGLKKILRGILPTAVEVGTVVVKNNLGSTTAATILRQVLLIGGGILTQQGLATDDQVQAGAAAVVTLGTLAYGLAKTVKEKKEKIAIADPRTPVTAVLEK
jgi:hypothetical protein